MPRSARAPAEPPEPGRRPAKTDPEPAKALLGESREHLYRAGMEFLLALQTFCEAWLLMFESRVEPANPWIDLGRKVLQDLARLTEAYEKKAPAATRHAIIAKLIGTLDQEIDAIALPMDEHKRAYRDALLGVKRVLAQTMADVPAEDPRGSFRAVPID
ncbi:MAG: hypothetical protein HYY13_13325 [Nitrospirae bacterium]|nr:hypothetical protein [Nitrospirota bacterium]